MIHVQITYNGGVGGIRNDKLSKNNIIFVPQEQLFVSMDADRNTYTTDIPDTVYNTFTWNSPGPYGFSL